MCQVVKVILTAVTSPNCYVHEGSLLLAVRSCFHIHLMSKSPVNKTTAKAALTQMISIVNQRMEIQDGLLKSKSEMINQCVEVIEIEQENVDLIRSVKFERKK